MKSIALFFGSFNPIHSGHVKLGEYVCTRPEIDEVWFVASPHNPLKKQSELVDEVLRLRMIELAIAENHSLKACDVEFDLPKPSYTIHTLQLLSERYPDHRFTLLIGSDNMQIFDQWKAYQTILNKYPIVVYPRKGFDYRAFEQKYPKMQILKDAPCFEVASTQIRAMIRLRQDVTKWLHPDVHRFIQKHKLYH